MKDEDLEYLLKKNNNNYNTASFTKEFKSWLSSP